MLGDLIIIFIFVNLIKNVLTDGENSISVLCSLKK